MNHGYLFGECEARIFCFFYLEKSLIREMARVNKNDIYEVRILPKPPADVQTVMTAVLLLMGEDEHTASVSMCVCTLAEMGHTRPE